MYIGYVGTLPNGYDVYAIKLDGHPWYFTATLDRPHDWDDATWWTREFAIEQKWIAS